MRRRIILASCLGVLLAGGAFLLARPEAGVACDLYAAPAGDDAAPGTEGRPVRSVTRLAALLAGGGTGCLRAGEFPGDLLVEAGGTQARPLVIRAVSPGESTVKGAVVVGDDASWVTLEGLRLDGSSASSREAVGVKIFGDHVTLRGNEITTAGQRICVQTGDANGRYGIAWYPVIEGNRIHDCGNRLTGSPSYPSGHGLYLQADRYARVAHNYIYDLNFGGTSGGRGIQLWPDSQFASIEHNVVDNANQWSIIISGGGGYPTGVTRGTKVRNNIFSNPVEHNVTSAWWDTDPQAGVEVTDNCVFNAPGGNFAFASWLGKFSYLEARNLAADPLYVDRAGKDFRLRPGSPCAGKGPQAPGAAVPAPGTAPAPAPAPAPRAPGAGGTTPAPPPAQPSPQPPPAAPSRPAEPKRSVRPRLHWSRGFRGSIPVDRTTASAGGAAAERTVTILRRTGSGWRTFARVNARPDGTFALERGLWSRAPQLVFRARVRNAAGDLLESPPLVLERLGRSPSRFAVR